MSEATCIGGSGAVGPAALGGLGGFPPGGEAALDTLTDNFSPTAENQGSQGLSQWLLLDYQRRESCLPRQRSCMLGAFADLVTGRRGERRVSFSGLMACGYRWCPICGPRIAHRMRSDLERVIAGWRADGGEVLFGTFTLSHDRDDRLGDLVDALMAGWHGVTSGKGWSLDRRRHGVAYWVRVMECKCSTSTGWHPHLHYLVFVEAPADHADALPVSDLLRTMFRRYSAALLRVGRQAELSGQYLEVATAEDVEALARYFVKEAEATSRGGTRELAFELAHGEGKRGRSGSVTPGELLEMAAAGDMWAAARLSEYEDTMLGRRFVGWARGLRERYEVEEISDLDVAQSDDDIPVMFQARAQSLRRLLGRRGKRVELVRRMLEDQPPAVVAWLQEWGVDAVEGTFDRQGVSVDESA